MTRYEEVRSVVAKAMARAVTSGVPVSSPQGCEIIANAVCEWMSGLWPIFLSDAELQALADGEDS